MRLVILAGGKGTRLGLTDRPKPMALVCGKPVLEHQVELAKRYGIREITVLLGHMGDAVSAHFGDGSKWGVAIDYVREESPLGTAGAVKQLEGRLTERFLLFYGDTMMDFDLARFMAHDRERAGAATLLVHPNDHPFDSDLVEADGDGRVTRFLSKPHPEGLVYRNLVNAAVYALGPSIFGHIRAGEASDFGKDVFPRALAAGEALHAYATHEYVKDMGTPERLRKVEADMASGKIAGLNRSNLQRAVFLDRDGVLCPDRDDLADPAGFELLPGAAEAVRLVNRSGRVCVVVTNQPAIAKGKLTEAGLAEIHKKMETLLGREGAYLDATYFCPHHPEKGHPGERPELKVACACRKPAPGMLLRAAQDLGIDLRRSHMVGDRTGDIAAGAAAGTSTIAVATGYACADGQNPCRPDARAADVLEAVRIALAQ